MKRILRNYFTFNKRERNGALILLFIISLLLLYLTFTPTLVSSSKTDFTAFEKEIAALTADTTLQLTSNIQPSPPQVQSPAAPLLADFNPNGLPATKWKQMGLSDKQIRTIKNYEAKGGKFYNKADVKKMYGLSDALYRRMEPYIVIPAKEITNTDKLPVTVITTELNTADSTALVQLKGIGPAFAKRIVNYRKLLGGFYQQEQLLEVYGIDSTKYKSILQHNSISIASEQIAQLNINMASIDELKRHPYIKSRLATLIVNYRLAHGPYKTVDELKKLELVGDELYVKLKNYIRIN